MPHLRRLHDKTRWKLTLLQSFCAFFLPETFLSLYLSLRLEWIQPYRMVSCPTSFCIQTTYQSKLKKASVNIDIQTHANDMQGGKRIMWHTVHTNAFQCFRLMTTFRTKFVTTPIQMTSLIFVGWIRATLRRTRARNSTPRDFIYTNLCASYGRCQTSVGFSYSTECTMGRLSVDCTHLLITCCALAK